MAAAPSIVIGLAAIEATVLAIILVAAASTVVNVALSPAAIFLTSATAASKSAFANEQVYPEYPVSHLQTLAVQFPLELQALPSAPLQGLARSGLTAIPAFNLSL